MDSSQDAHWHTVLTLVLLAPHPDLPAAKNEYWNWITAWKKGRSSFPAVKRFCTTPEGVWAYAKEAPDPLAQQITLRNRDEIQPYIDALTAQA